MADINKPDLTNLWASDGAVIPPSPAKIQTGWVAEIPPHQWENYVQNRQDVALAYLLQKGIPEWDNTTEYIADKSVVTYDGNIYFAIQTSTNNNPSSSPSHWIPLEEKFADNLGLGTAATRDVGTGPNEVPANSNLGAAAYLPIATTSQAQELTNDATVITPKKLADAFAGPNGDMSEFGGYQILPGEQGKRLMIQWGGTPADFHGQRVVFPVSFGVGTTPRLSITPAKTGATTPNDFVAYTDADRDGFTYLSSTTASSAWLAIGRV